MVVQIRTFMKHCKNILISILVIIICFLYNQVFRLKWWIGKTNDVLLMLLEKREHKEEDYDSEAVERGKKFVDNLLSIIFQNREAFEPYRVEDKVVTIDQNIAFINIHGKFGLCSTNLQFNNVFQKSSKCSLREEDDKIRVNAVIGVSSLLLKTNACIEFLLLTRIFPMNGFLPYTETYIEFEFDKGTHKNGKILELFIDDIRGMYLKFEDGGVLKMILNIILNISIKFFQSLLKIVLQSELKAELNMLIKNFEFPAEIVPERQLHSIESREPIMSRAKEDSVSEQQYMEPSAPEEYQTVDNNGDSQVQDFSMQAQHSQASELIKDSPLVKPLETSQALDRFLDVEGSEILQDSEVSMLIKNVKESQTSESILAPRTPESLSVTECEASQGPESFSLSKQQGAFQSHERSLVKKRVTFQPLSDSSEYEECEACEVCPLIGSPLEECDQSQTLDDSAFVEESEDNEKLSVPETPCTLQPFSDKKEFLPLAVSPLTDKNEDTKMDPVLKASSSKKENIEFSIPEHSLHEKKVLDISDTSEKQCDAACALQASPGQSRSLTEFSVELKEPKTSLSSKDSDEELRKAEDAKSMKQYTFETALNEQDDRCISQAVFEQGVHTGLTCEAEKRSEKHLTPRISSDEREELFTSDSLSCTEQKVKTEALIQEELSAGGQTMDTHTIDDIPVAVQSKDIFTKYELSEELLCVVESTSSEEQHEDPSSSEDSSELI